MSPMLWWLIPVLATIGAIAWSAWSGRSRRPSDTNDSVAAYQRFAAAITNGADARDTDSQQPEHAHR